MENYTDFLKIIKDLFMEAKTLSWWRFILIILMIIVLALIWRLPEILSVILK